MKLTYEEKRKRVQNFRPIDDTFLKFLQTRKYPSKSGGPLYEAADLRNCKREVLRKISANGKI